MFERFTERSRQVVVLAQDAARDFDKRRIDTEHLLLGLIAEREGLAAWALVSVGVDPEQTYAGVSRLVPAAHERVTGQVPFTSRAKRALELAAVEADRRRSRSLSTEHLLLGLTAELADGSRDDVALRVLGEQGVTLEEIRAAVEKSAPASGADLSWMVRRTPEIEFRAVAGAGWIDVLELSPAMQLRQLLVRAAAAAMDRQQTTIEGRDLLDAFGALPAIAEMLDAAGVVPFPADRAVESAVERDWTRIDAGEQVLAAIVAAQRRALRQHRSAVTVDDLLLTLCAEQALLLSRGGWDPDALRRLLKRNRERPDQPQP